MLMERKYDPAVYQDISILDLILFSIYSVISKKEVCTFERLVKECFDLFPKRFSFEENSKWPDSRKLDRSLRSLRKEELIKGSPKISFTLTKKGERIAVEISKSLRQKKLL